MSGRFIARRIARFARSCDYARPIPASTACSRQRRLFMSSTSSHPFCGNAMSLAACRVYRLIPVGAVLATSITTHGRARFVTDGRATRLLLAWAMRLYASLTRAMIGGRITSRSWPAAPICSLEVCHRRATRQRCPLDLMRNEGGIEGPLGTRHVRIMHGDYPPAWARRSYGL